MRGWPRHIAAVPCKWRQTEVIARIARVGANELLKKRGGLIELFRGDVSAAELMLIHGVGRIGRIGFFESGDGLGVIASGQIQRSQQVMRGSKLRFARGDLLQSCDGFIVFAFGD